MQQRDGCGYFVWLLAVYSAASPCALRSISLFTRPHIYHVGTPEARIHTPTYCRGFISTCSIRSCSCTESSAPQSRLYEARLSCHPRRGDPPVSSHHPLCSVFVLPAQAQHVFRERLTPLQLGWITKSQILIGVPTCNKSKVYKLVNATIRLCAVIQDLLCSCDLCLYRAAFADFPVLSDAHSYPAGHVWVYTALYHLTRQGKDIRTAQYLFAALYITTLAVVFRLYRYNAKVSAWASWAA